ncbi:hypothetical protein CLOSTHATH_04914 [Hungatella hathewayi DSM 13479]|uniref:Uncharacterized protein n=1 Tax=Hungatella hathewayi DSM 13479 TaxID=566550 RepID=D3AMR4_9FIRM|nr:hypothetical protein CLOSTHATH_04914 [Hungatella hathewayi DSM 13479]
MLYYFELAETNLQNSYEIKAFLPLCRCSVRPWSKNTVVGKKRKEERIKT